MCVHHSRATRSSAFLRSTCPPLTLFSKALPVPCYDEGSEAQRHPATSLGTPSKRHPSGAEQKEASGRLNGHGVSGRNKYFRHGIVGDHQRVLGTARVTHEATHITGSNSSLQVRTRTHSSRSQNNQAL